MTPSEQGNIPVAVSLAYSRAAANVGGMGLAQKNVVGLLHQVSDIQQEAEDPAGAKLLIAARAHGSDFRIAIVVATDGAVGWSLV